ALSPRDDHLYQLRGRVYQKRGEFPEAVADYTRAIELHPDDDLAYFNRAIVRKDLGELDAAVADLDEAVRIDPRDGVYRLQRGLLRLDLDDADGAIEDSTAAWLADPGNDSLKELLAVVYRHRGHARLVAGEGETAAADFTRALELEPDDVETL